MKRTNLAMVIITIGTLMFGGQVMAGKSSVEMGEKLFKDPALGGSTNTKNCNNCHAGGKDLENASNSKKLVKQMNRCITGYLEGNKIDGRSAEMRSLKMYIKTLATN